jgi:hypothetical protein
MRGAPGFLERPAFIGADMRFGVTLLRLCFALRFGAMSMMHGPVMTFAGVDQTMPAGHAHAGHAGHAAVPDCHDEGRPAGKPAGCNAFACFIAALPHPVAERPITPVLFAVMAAAQMTALDPAPAAPNLPPPRLQS